LVIPIVIEDEFMNFFSRVLMQSPQDDL